MVFTIVILAVFALMFTFAYMLQKVSLERTAAYIARQGAEIWTDSRKSIEDGAVDFSKEEDSLYYRISDNLLFRSEAFEWNLENLPEKGLGNSLPLKKVEKIKDALCKNLTSLILKPGNTNIRVAYSNNLLKGQLTVEITQEVGVPLGGIKAFFDGKDTATLQGRAVSTIIEPAEYIRNIDLAVELSGKMKDSIDFQDILDRISGGKQQE